VSVVGVANRLTSKS